MSENDTRPAVWVGHVELDTSCLEASARFMRTIGMRPIVEGDDFAVLELRGGTHLVLVARETVAPTDAPFDLMVDDLEGTHERFTEIGLSPTPIETGRIHRWFHVTEPAGHRIQFNSSHVSDEPV